MWRVARATCKRMPAKRPMGSGWAARQWLLRSLRTSSICKRRRSSRLHASFGKRHRHRLPASPPGAGGLRAQRERRRRTMGCGGRRGSGARIGVGSPRKEVRMSHSQSPWARAGRDHRKGTEDAWENAKNGKPRRDWPRSMLHPAFTSCRSGSRPRTRFTLTSSRSIRQVRTEIERLSRRRGPARSRAGRTAAGPRAPRRRRRASPVVRARTRSGSRRRLSPSRRAW
jgi:hypothetical protein